MDIGAMVFPMVNRREAAAKYWPLISSGAIFDTKLCCRPAVINSPRVKTAIARINPQIHCVWPNIIMAAAYVREDKIKRFLSLCFSIIFVTATVIELQESRFRKAEFQRPAPHGHEKTIPPFKELLIFNKVICIDRY
jgi:hypothetical protein